ncbi:hypothetical protein CEXT_598331 [Caerostris extrusa]|uniref:Uncharacterized protein n=1 Tax=Caerostris extrusa TaxID=172846 RepID=A0AAV4NBB5_CAEEX|nr:hypothetical protein CEXT_598331 [Caerostris extrusa]
MRTRAEHRVLCESSAGTVNIGEGIERRESDGPFWEPPLPLLPRCGRRTSRRRWLSFNLFVYFGRDVFSGGRRQSAPVDREHSRPSGIPKLQSMQEILREFWTPSKP